jgi:hypothetical protein
MLGETAEISRTLQDYNRPFCGNAAGNLLDWVETMFDAKSYWLSRAVFQTGLALVYLIAFVCALNQFLPLLGEHGLLPAPDFIKQVPFREAPSLFYFYPKDVAFVSAAVVGILLSAFAATGLSERSGNWVSMPVWSLLWILDLSFVNVGQEFYAFGWESILLEAGFFAIFLGSRKFEPSRIVLWLLRWLEFRVMFGAGLIKLRGDPCWRDYTCLDFHYETQPMPNGLSYTFHWGSNWMHRLGVGFNHVAELIVPFGYFLPQPAAGLAGIVTILFQAFIMAGGNFSFLNVLTMVLALPLLNDRFFAIMLPFKPAKVIAPSVVWRLGTAILAVVVMFLSINPIRNMVSSRQVMNTIYNPLHLVGTYGAFGSISRTRNEIIIVGTDESVITPATNWKEYEFYGKPGDLSRTPPQIAPYHLRLDWEMWFAAMSDYSENPWFSHLIEKLLLADPATINLIRNDPFGYKRPHFIKADLYEYHFTTEYDRQQTGLTWNRKFLNSYMPPVSLDTPDFRRVLTQQGWK